MTIAALLIALIASPNAGEAGAPVLLDFHASWCGPCQQMRPAVEQLIRKGYPVKSIDIDRSPKLAERYNVTAVPTFIVVDASGRSLARTEGFQPATQLAGLYREAKAKSHPPASPARGPVQADADADTDADRPDEAEEAPEDGDTAGDGAGAGAVVEEEVRPRPTPHNPRPWESVVRIRVHGNGSIGFGSGTIVHSTAEESIILTCAHIFKLEGARQAPPRQFPRRITIDLFDGKLNGQQPPMVHFLESVEGEAIDYDFSRDVGLIRIRPGRRLPASRIVPASWVPRSGMKMTTVGCSFGQDATAWTTSIVHPTIRGLADSPSYEAIECVHAPRQGRSGGGLYTEDGYVAGVCDFAEPQGNHGLYATPRSIHALLDRNNLMALYEPANRRGGALLARNRPAPSPARPRPPSIARAQSPDRDESGQVLIPDPELLGIRKPALAQGTARGGSAWHRRPASRPLEDQDQAERTDLSLAPAADDDRFGPMPADEPEASTADEPSETRPAPRSLGRWRPVKSRLSEYSTADSR